MPAENRTILKSYFETGDIPTEGHFINLIDSFEMVESMPPTKNATYTFYMSVVSQVDNNIFQTNPTIAPGDFKVSIDGGALNDLTNLPVVTPAGSKMIKIILEAAEMNGDRIVVLASDAAGAEWQDMAFEISTTLG